MKKLGFIIICVVGAMSLTNIAGTTEQQEYISRKKRIRDLEIKVEVLEKGKNTQQEKLSYAVELMALASVYSACQTQRLFFGGAECDGFFKSMMKLAEEQYPQLAEVTIPKGEVD